MKIYFTYSLSTLFIINLSVLIMIFAADYIRNKIYFKATYDELKNSYSLFQKYIDRYYIINLKYTILASTVYIINTIILFLFIRYLFIGQAIFLLRLDNSIINVNNWDFIKFILKYLSFLITIFLYKILLQILFFKEIIKLRIYLQKFEQYDKINDLCKLRIGEYICKLIWMLSYRITMQTFSDNLFEGEYDNWKDNALDYNEQNYSYIYDNFYINKAIKNLMYISKKYVIISKLFYYNAKLFKFISRHISNGLFKFVPYMLIILCLMYELYTRELYFIYYVTFIYFIILNFRKIEQNLDFISITNLKDYFYKNEFPYSAQRFYIINSAFSKDESYEEIYNFKYDIIFWIIVFLQSYFYWLVLLKPELFFMSTEILIELPFKTLKIIKVYSQEEKVIYLFQYFEFYSKAIPKEDLDKVDIDFLRYIIRQLDYVFFNR